MDPATYVHHHRHHHHNNHPRYVPLSPSLHPPPPPSHPTPYQQSPNNLYPSRHHLPPPQPPPQLRPPPLPPPPLQQQRPYHPLPAAPPPVPRQQHLHHHPYNPHHPQYISNPNFNSNPNPNNVSHQFHDFPVRRLTEFDPRPDYRHDNRVSRLHPVSNLDQEARYHQFDRRPASPGIDRFRHDLDESSRFRDVELNHREREEVGRVHRDHWISERSTRDFGTVSMGFESSSNNLSFCDPEVAENVRRVSRLHDELIDNGNNEINERNEMRVFSRKTDYYFDSETERFSERGSVGEDSHGKNRTPKQQTPKKSALLRIQKVTPNYRSREDERSHYLGYHNQGKTGAFRGKDLVSNLDHAMEEKEREGSPVELDVSFKSNSLVAKAVVTPSSSTSVSDSSMMPRNTKIRRLTSFDKDCLSLQPNKANESSTKLQGSTSVVKSVSGSEDSKKSEGKVKTPHTGNVQDGISKPLSKGANVSLRKGELKKFPKATVKLDDSSCVSVTKDVPIFEKKQEPLEGKGKTSCSSKMVDVGTQACYDRANVSVRENKVEGTLKSTVSDKTGASVGKPSSLKATKKKTIVRKVVRKVTNSSLNLAPDSSKRGNQSVKSDTSTSCPSAATSAADKSVMPLKMKIAAAAAGSVHDVASDCCPKESALLHENEKVSGASKEEGLEKVGTDADPGSSVASKIKRERKSLSPPLSSLGHEETKVNPGNADSSIHGLHIISNIEDQTETPNESITSGTLIVEDVKEQFHHNESIICYGLSRSEDVGDGGIVDIGSSSVAMHRSVGFDCDSFNAQEINISCDIGIVNSGSKPVCATPGGSVVEDGTTGGLPETNCLVGSNKKPHLPCSQETQIKSDSIHADCFKHNRSAICNPDNVYVNSGEGSHEIDDDLAKHTSPSTLSVGNSDTEGNPNAVESLECKDECAANVHKRKGRIGDLDLSSSAFTNISTGSADCLNPTISTSSINSNAAEFMLSGIGWIDVGLQHSRDEVSILQRSSSNDTFPEVSATADVKSPERKKRKIVTSSSSVTASLVSQGVAVSSVQLPSDISGDLLQLRHEGSSMDGLHTEGIDLFPVNRPEVGPSQAVGYLRDVNMDDHPGIDPSSPYVQSVVPSSPCLRPLKLGGKQISTAMPVSSANNQQIDATDVEGDGGVKVHVDTAEDLKIISSEVTQCIVTPEHKSVSLDQRLPSTDVEDDNQLPLEDNLPFASNSLVFGVDANVVSVTNSTDEPIPAPAPYIPSDVGSPNSHDNLVSISSTCKTPFCQKSEEKAYVDEKLSDDKPMIESGCDSSGIVSFSQHGKSILKSNDATQTNQFVAGKAGLLPLHDSKNTNSPNFMRGETHGRKNHLSHVVPKSYPARSSFVFSASKNTSSTEIRKPRTWHRTDNSSAALLSGNKPSLSANPLERQIPKKSAYLQSTSYIRKGNSLVRKPVSAPSLPQGSHSLSSSVYRLNSGVVDEVKKGIGPNSTADAVELRTGGANTTFERPTTPPLSSVTKANRTSNSRGECTSSPLAEPSVSDCCVTMTEHSSCMEINDVLNSTEEGLKTSETLNRNGSVNDLEHWTEQNEGDLVPSNAKSVTYLKPKSNQLVATSDCGRTSVLNADKNQSSSASSDGYYKTSKNQLIRTAFENHIKQAVLMSDNKSNSVGDMAAKVISGKTSGKRRSNKVVAKTHKPSKFSLVWTLHGAKLSNNDRNSLRHPKVVPNLFPWKRMTYRSSFKLNSVSSSNSSLSTISRKMLLLRKRNTVYTRSINGFSIRKSKVLSVGGSSLKWSQSIERHSRKASEEATLAVAEAERKRRERNDTISGTGKRSHSSLKVVHGIELRPDGESSSSAGLPSENSTKKSCVPKRLVIGNDEYVRIGNGNQLVRDPKKRTRVLASEKVRWSLHTARLRLVKKRKYCQFFTRFGKCNKDDGKCPYIHDPSKIAVCTKFLKGLCSNPNCRLTHKVIPERMPDCSYFLQGLCTNENCPYRHVHVNPNAPTCEGFLRGYCADGNECRKKHSYVCPNFEATGSCPQGSKCKLLHPKNRSKGKKSKKSMEHKNARGRYFVIDILEPKRTVSETERHQALGNDCIFFDGKFSDYIGLDVSDDEAGELHNVMRDQTTLGDDDSSGLQLDDLDELIKPIRIMNKYKITESFSMRLTTQELNMLYRE